MKITSGNNSELNSSKKIENQPLRGEFESAAIDNLKPDSTQKSDFAGVLDRVTRSHKESSHQPTERSARDMPDPHERKTKEEDTVANEASVVNIDQPITREVQPNTDVSNEPRAILHTVDLDKMVTACQVNLAANGQHEVTLELSRSMLDGLRVKVTSDAAGHIKADFLAANEGIKALLDSRSAELIDQLRSRGINLTEFKSSVAADAGGRNFSSERDDERTAGEGVRGRSEAVTSLNESEANAATEDVLANGATYRA